MNNDESHTPNNEPPTAAADTSELGETPVVEERPKIERQPAPTPFDHPLSFPALLLALVVWFGYDGWFNPKIEAIVFNRVMFGILSVAFFCTLWMGLAEMRDDRKQKEQGQSS